MQFFMAQKIKQNHRFVKQLLALFVVGIFMMPQSLLAESVAQYIPREDVEIGYRIQTDSSAYISLAPQSFHRSLFVDFSKTELPNPVPPDKDMVSSVYWYAFLPAQNNTLEHNISVSMQFPEQETRWKEIYLYNTELGAWTHLPGEIDIENSVLHTETRWASGYIAVFADHLDKSEYIKERINSPSIFVADAHTGEILIERASETQRPIASLTKLATAATFLDHNPGWNQKVTFQTADDTIPAKIYVKTGDVFTAHDLFYATLLKSANNAAKALARSTGMPEQEFVSDMNQTAEKYGMKRTHFVEPTGLSDQNISTAQDIYTIAKSLFADPLFLQVTTPKAYTIAAVNTGKKHTLINSNKLLDVPYIVLGSKTGFTYEAGRCLVMKVKNKAGREVIAVTMGADTPGAHWDDMRLLLDATLGE